MTEKKRRQTKKEQADAVDLLKVKSPWSQDEAQNARTMAVTLDSLTQALAAMEPGARRDFERGAKDYRHIAGLIDDTSGHLMAVAHFVPQAGLRPLLIKVLPSLFEIRLRLERLSRGLPPVPPEPQRPPYVPHDCLTREHDPEEWCPDCFPIDANGKPKKSDKEFHKDMEVL